MALGVLQSKLLIHLPRLRFEPAASATRLTALNATLICRLGRHASKATWSCLLMHRPACCSSATRHCNETEGAAVLDTEGQRHTSAAKHYIRRHKHMWMRPLIACSCTTRHRYNRELSEWPIGWPDFWALRPTKLPDPAAMLGPALIVCVLRSAGCTCVSLCGQGPVASNAGIALARRKFYRACVLRPLPTQAM